MGERLLSADKVRNSRAAGITFWEWALAALGGVAAPASHHPSRIAQAFVETIPVDGGMSRRPVGSEAARQSISQGATMSVIACALREIHLTPEATALASPSGPPIRACPQASVS